MKVLLIILVCFIGAGQQSMGQTEKQIREAEKETLEKSQRVLEELVRYHQNKEIFSREQVKGLADSLQDLTYWINQLIMAKKSPDWTNPTRERLTEIKKWGEVIQPYNKHLAEEALTSSADSLYQRLSSESLGVLNFTLPDEQLEKVVASKLSETKNLNVSKRAAKILVEHRIFDDSHKEMLSKKGAHLTGKSEIKWIGSVAQFGVESDLEKVVDYLNSLEFEGDNPDQYISYLGPVFQVMNGSVGRNEILRLPLERVLEIFNQKAPGYAVRITEAIESIEYSGPKKRRYARNGSGYLDESIDWEGVGTVQNVERPKSTTGKKPLLTNKNKGDLRLPEEEVSEAEQSPSRVPWIFAGVLLVGILLLLLKTIKSKSTS